MNDRLYIRCLLLFGLLLALLAAGDDAAAQRIRHDLIGRIQGAPERAPAEAPAPSLSSPAFWSMWNFSPESFHRLYDHLDGDTTSVRLRSLVAAPGADTTQHYWTAITLLIHRHYDAAFVLDELQRYAQPGDDAEAWARAYDYHRARGWYGDADAVASMDSVATFGYGLERLHAVGLLAEAADNGADPQERWSQHFDYIRQEVEQAFSENLPLTSLSFDPLTRFAYRGGTEGAIALDLLEDYARIPEYYNHTRQARVAGIIRSMDWARGTSLLEDLLVSTSDPEARGDFYRTLQRGDSRAVRDARAIQLIPTVQDPTFRSEMLGDLITGHLPSGLFHATATPQSIRFIKEWLPQEPLLHFRQRIEAQLERFQPVPPDWNTLVTVSPSQILDEFSALVDTMQAYAWITPLRFADTLHVHLARADAALTTGDSARVAYEAEAVQHFVDWAYRHPNAQTRTATREGHRFLWWTARHLLDRLPDPAYPTLTDVRPLLECVADNGDGTLTAYFGYNNRDGALGRVPYGSGNRLLPLNSETTVSYDGQQPEVFAVPGAVSTALGRTPPYPGHAFTVTFPATLTLEWTLLGRTKAADASSPSCP